TYSSNDAYSDTSTRLDVTVNQALLRGAGLNVNLATLRQAQLDTKISQYELRAVAESLVAQVELTYWDYALAQRQIEIYQTSLEVAQQQLDQTNELIRVGRIAENERAAAEAEVALRRENLINVKATLETTRLTLLQLLNPGKTNQWERDVTLKEKPFIPQGALEAVQAHVEVALARRPDLNQAKLHIQRGDLQIIKTKNGLLPQMNLFVTLGKTGYSRAFGGTIPALNGPDYDALVGMQFDISPLNTAARAAHRQSVLTKEQAQESLENLTLLAQVDVRSAYIEVNRLREQITATAATRTAQEATYRAEKEKFRVGKSTALLVATAQRDLVQAQINEVQAVTGFLKSLIALYHVEGSLLERRGIEAPGAQTVTEAGVNGRKAGQEVLLK
ncbi:MAG: TolC family protein, partial [Phycisphaerae bacterium]